MDYMDIDHAEVPDTPDRLITRTIDGRGCAENEIGSSVATHSGSTELLDEGARNQLSNRSKQATDNGLSRRQPYSLPGQSLSICRKPERDRDFPTSLGNSSSSKNTHLFRRRVSDKSANHGKDCLLDSHLKEKGNSICASQPSMLAESAVVDLTEQHGMFHTFENPSSGMQSEDQYPRGIRREATSTHGFPSLNHRGKCPIAMHTAFKGKEKIDDASCKGGLVVDHGKGMYDDSQPKTGKSISASFRSIPFPRASGQKRLVRNGCISPHNIEKAKQLAEDDQSNGSMDVQNHKEPAASDCSSSLIRDLIAEDNTSLKGQAGRSYQFSSKEACSNSISTRPFSSHREDGRGNSNANGDASGHFEGLSGWRNTRNRTERVNFPPSHDDHHLPQTKNDSCFVKQPIGKRVMERQNWSGSSSRISNDKDKDHNADSFWLGSTPPVSQPVSVPISQSQVNGRRTAASTLLKRQKQGSASSSNSESSKLPPVDSDLVFLGSSGEPTNPGSNRTQFGHGIGNLDPIIEIDALSPELQHGLPHDAGRVNNDDTDARSRQIEADEMLARELQEQLYNEVPGVGDGEIDAQIELALHQADASRHAFSGRSPPVFHPRDSVFSNLYRQSQSRSSQNPTSRRGIQARGPTPSRLTRMRNHLPSQSARVSYRERSSLFPPNMDVDMRIHILEALEAFSDMEMVGNFLQDDREFNENDYEMLLALDENNHQHGGASLDQINILPQSIVQGDNFEESCAICLETPSSGDMIRHLPCLHKFHKDCIDPWLRRRTSCPVCKSSIT